MPNWNRRSVMAIGAAFATGGALSSVVAGSDDDCSCPSSDDEATDGPSGWSSYRANAGNTAYVPADGAFPEPDVIAWEYDEYGAPAIVDGTVYLRTGTEVHALDDDDGSRLWTSSEIGAGGVPAVVDDVVLVGGDQLTALEADTGEVRWIREFDTDEDDTDMVVTNPTVASGIVYVVAEETLFAFDVADGSLEWSCESVELEREVDDSTRDQFEDREVSFASVTVAVANGFVYAGVGEGLYIDGTTGFAALDASTGETRWTYWKPWHGDEDPHGYIMATENGIYVGSISDGPAFPILDPRTGEQIGSSNGHRFPSALSDEAVAAVGRHGFSVSRYETEDDWSRGGGTDTWRIPMIVGDTVIIPYEGDAYPSEIGAGLYGFDVTDGTKQWSFSHPDINFTLSRTSQIAATADTIYMWGENGIVAIRSSPDEEEDGDDESDSGEDGDETEGDDGDESHDDETDESTGDEETAADDEGAADDSVTEDDGDTDEEDASDDETDGDDTDESAGGDEEDASDDETDEEDDATGGEADEEDEPADGDEGDDEDATPGFTTGAGILGGALSLEWLRRRATLDEPDE